MLDVEWDVGLTRSDDLMSRDLDSNLDDRLGSQISRHHRRTDRAHRGSPLEPTHLYFVSFTRQLKSRAQPQATVDQARRPPYSSLVGCGTSSWPTRVFQSPIVECRTASAPLEVVAHITVCNGQERRLSTPTALPARRAYAAPKRPSARSALRRPIAQIWTSLVRMAT